MFANASLARTEVIPIENLNVSEPDGWISAASRGRFYSRQPIYVDATYGNFTESVITMERKSWTLHWIKRRTRPMELLIGFDMFICNDWPIQWSVGMRKPTRIEPWTRCPSICMSSMVPVEPTRDWVVAVHCPTDLEHVNAGEVGTAGATRTTFALVESIGSRKT